MSRRLRRWGTRATDFDARSRLARRDDAHRDATPHRLRGAFCRCTWCGAIFWRAWDATLCDPCARPGRAAKAAP